MSLDRKAPRMLGKLSLFKWEPDPDELREILTGETKMQRGDVTRIGEQDGGRQDSR